MIISRSLGYSSLILRINQSYHNYYDVLEVEHGASQMEIKRKFYELAKKYHPDNQHGNTDPRKFIQIKQAYETLGDEKKRIRYDNSFFSQNRSNSNSDYSTSQAGFQRPYPNYYQYDHKPYQAPQSFFTLFKRNWFSALAYIIYAYMFVEVFVYFSRKLDQKQRQHKQMMLESSHTVTQSRRKFYANEMKEKGIYGQNIDLKFRLLTKESTRSAEKKKLGMTSIEGIEKQGKVQNDIVIKPEYI